GREGRESRRAARRNLRVREVVNSRMAGTRTNAAAGRVPCRQVVLAVLDQHALVIRSAASERGGAWADDSRPGQQGVQGRRPLGSGRGVPEGSVFEVGQ